MPEKRCFSDDEPNETIGSFRRPAFTNLIKRPPSPTFSSLKHKLQAVGIVQGTQGFSPPV